MCFHIGIQNTLNMSHIFMQLKVFYSPEKSRGKWIYCPSGRKSFIKTAAVEGLFLYQNTVTDYVDLCSYKTEIKLKVYGTTDVL